MNMYKIRLLKTIDDKEVTGYFSASSIKDLITKVEEAYGEEINRIHIKEIREM